MKNLLTSRSMKMIAAAAVMASLAVVGGKILMPPVSLATTASATPTTRTVSAYGQSSIQVTPDVAYIMVGAFSKENTSVDASKKNADLMDKILKALKDKGVKDTEIQTTDFSLNPSYDYSKDSPKMNGFEVRNMVSVTVNDVTKVGELLDAALAAGANISNGVNFSVKDTSKVEKDAMEAAVLDAKSRAETLAKAAGKTLGDAVTIQETQGGMPTPMYKTAAQDAATASAGTSISSGSFTISTGVSVTYELK